MTQDIFERDNRILSLALSRCAEGDKKSFRVIYDMTFRQFMSVAFDILHDEESAKDVLQTAYLSIWKSANRYDPNRAKAFTWMLVITRNRALDALRSRKRAPFLDDIQDVDWPDLEVHLEKLADVRQAFGKVAKQMDTLPTSVARAIRMQIFYGFTSSEIAKLENVSQNTVKSWVRRGLEKLREDVSVRDALFEFSTT